MNLLEALSKLINDSSASVEILNETDTICELDGIYQEARDVAMQVEELDARGDVAPAKVARHFQYILAQRLELTFPEAMMDDRLFNLLQDKIRSWNSKPDSPDDVNSVFKDSLIAVLTKKRVEQKLNEWPHLIEEKNKWRREFLTRIESCMTDPSSLAEVFNYRQSIAKNKAAYTAITANEIPQIVHAIDSQDASTYSLYSSDAGRLGNELLASGFTQPEINAMKNSEKLKLEAAIFSTASIIIMGTPDVGASEALLAYKQYRDICSENNNDEEEERCAADQRYFRLQLPLLAKPYIEYHRARNALQENIDQQLQQIAQLKQHASFEENAEWLEKQIALSIDALSTAAPSPVERNFSTNDLYEQTNNLTKANNHGNAVILVGHYMQARALFRTNFDARKVSKKTFTFALEINTLINTKLIPEKLGDIVRALEQGELKTSVLQEITTRANAINIAIENNNQQIFNETQAISDYFQSRLNLCLGEQTTPQTEAMLKETEQLRLHSKQDEFPLVELTHAMTQVQADPSADNLAAWQYLLVRTQYQQAHAALNKTVSELKWDDPRKTHNQEIVFLTRDPSKGVSPHAVSQLASTRDALQAAHNAIKVPSSNNLAALERATAASPTSELHDLLIGTHYFQTRKTLEIVLKEKEAAENIKANGQAMLILTQDVVGKAVVGKDVAGKTAVDKVMAARDALKATINVINDSSEANKQQFLQAQNLMHYYQAQAQLQKIISSMPNTTHPHQQRSGLQKKLDRIEQSRNDAHRDPQTTPVIKLTQELKDLQEIVKLEMRYDYNLDALERTIKGYKASQSKSPFIAYGEEILKLCKLKVTSEFGDKVTPGDMQLHQLSETLMTTKNAIEVCSNPLTYTNDLMTESKKCMELGRKLAPPDKVKASTRKKIGGILLGIAGVLLIAACIAVAVATYGAATPLSIAGMSLGISCIAAGAAMGTVAAVSGVGLFKDRKPHAMKIKESLDKIASAADKKVADANAPVVQAQKNKSTPKKDDDKPPPSKEPEYSGW